MDHHHDHGFGGRRSIWLSCLKAAPGEEIKQLMEFYQKHGVYIEDIEIFPKRRAVVVFKTAADCSKAERLAPGRSAPFQLGMMVKDHRKYEEEFAAEQLSDVPCPEGVYYRVMHDKTSHKNLKDLYQAFLVMSMKNGALLRAPRDKIVAAAEHLKVKYPDAYARVDVHRHKAAERGRPEDPSEHRAPRGTALRMYVAYPRSHEYSELPGDHHGRKPPSAPEPARRQSEIDAFISDDTMDYIEKVYKWKLEEIGTTYGVRFHRQEKNKVVVRNNNRQHNKYLEEAFDEFEVFYQKVFFSLTNDTFDLKECILPYNELIERVQRVGERFPKVLLVFDKEASLSRHIKIYGSAQDVENVLQLLKYTTGPASLKRNPASPGAYASPTSPTSAAVGAHSRDGMGYVYPDERRRTDDPRYRTDVRPATTYVTTLEHPVSNPREHVPGREMRRPAVLQNVKAEKQSYRLAGGFTTVMIEEGDILQQDTEVIVNAADRQLQHFGGVAWAISKAAGPNLQKLCNNYVSKYGNLKVGEVFLTEGYQMNIRFIFHAVGPSSAMRDAPKILKDTCYKILKCADTEKIKSIAIPALSTGRFGMKKEEYAEAMCRAIKKFSTSYPTTVLQKIKLVDIDPFTSIALVHCAEKILVPAGAIKLVSSRKDTTSQAQFHQAVPMAHGSTGKTVAASDRDTGGETEMVIRRKGSDPDLRAPKERLNARSKRSTIHSSTMTAKVDPNPASEAAFKGLAASERVPGTHSKYPGAAKPVVKEDEWKKVEPKKESPPVKNAWASATTCPVCFDDITEPKILPRCGHKFCKGCIDEALQRKAVCPVCNDIVGMRRGDQPAGNMTYDVIDISLPGYPEANTIQIKYDFPDGVQGEEHPTPGKPYRGTKRVAFLPDTMEGKEVLVLLKKAFEARLLFTIGTSISTGQPNVVVWNDVHHKTSIKGGPTNYGYPDETYLARVKEELAAKGIK